jgi:pimeloyl-ACP methyl ester carboxylesterase
MIVVKQPLRHLVIVIPGLGGSVLRDHAGARLWGGGLTRFAASTMLPAQLSVDENPHLVPTGLLSTVGDLPGFANVHPYDGLLKRLRHDFLEVVVDDGHPDHRNLNANVVAFPFDFRRSLVEAAERLATDIAERRERLGNPSVVVIGHSTGGLVGRYWMGPLGGWQVSRGLITMGTPHRGVPKVADWLANGARIAGIRLPGATEVIRSWPSLYELLPHYRAINLFDESTGWWRPSFPHEVPASCWASRALRAHGTYADTEDAWNAVAPNDMLPNDMLSNDAVVRSGCGGGDGPPLDRYALYGSGHSTTQSLTYRDGVLTASDDTPPWLIESKCAGDGTVPPISAIPLDLKDHRSSWHGTGDRNGAIGLAGAAIDHLKMINSTLPMPRRAAEVHAPSSRPTIGGAMPEQAWADNRLTVSFALHGTAPDDSARWTVDLRTDDGAAHVVQGVRVESSGLQCDVHVPPLDPGRYRVSVSAARGVVTEPVRFRDYLTVVTP